MKKRKPLSFLLLLLIAAICCQCRSSLIYESPNLKIKRLSKNSFAHISYLNTQSFGRVACNGAIFISEDKAIVMDCPADDKTSGELIQWIQVTKKAKIKAVIINHYHEDCLGGLQAFHEAGVSSYANEQTIALVDQELYPLPQNGFQDSLVLEVGGRPVISRYFGEAHTTDNIVSWIPSEKLLFGGCMVKSLGAGQGYTGDANVEEWSNTVNRVKNTYQDFKWVIPGHGKVGKVDLLDYTINMFAVD